MTLEHLSPLDSAFLHIEDSVTHMHIGSVSVFEGPPPPYSTLCDMIAGKLPTVRRYRQVVRRVPLDLGRPVWVDDPYFDLGFHVRHTALPRPGSMEQLCNLVGRLMAQQLDRARPLWEMWMVEGLPDDSWALVSKVHHCMVDGISGSDLLGLILDVHPDAKPVEPPPWIPDLPPADWELVVDALEGVVTSPFEVGRLLRARTRALRRVAAQVGEGLGSLLAAAETIRGASNSCLNGPIGPHRRWVPTSVGVEQVKKVRHSLGGTFNDVVLAAITRGFRDLLAARGDPLNQPLRSLMPVSVRARDERGRAVGDGTLANKISAVFAELPVQLADPLERLRAISAQTAGLKESNQAVAGEVLTQLSGFAPPMMLSLAGRLVTKLSQKRVNTVTTNVPGPQIPLYALGRRMTHVYPYVPLGMQMRVAVAIFSYDGEVSFGVTGDYDSMPDLSLVAEGIEAGMQELLEAASSASGAKIVDIRPASRAEPSLERG